MENVQSKRGKEKLNHEGHFYVFYKLSADRFKRLWLCEVKNECKARLHTTMNNLVRMQMNTHRNGIDAAQLVRSEINRNGTETTEIPSVNLNGALQQTSTAVQAKMPNIDGCRKVILLRRNENQAAPPQPADRASIIIPCTYRIYEVAPGQMEEFLLWNSGEQDKNRILLFGSHSNSERSHLIES
ncbi:hypothetical protein HZS_212 [Henneguya salminicola]|nr:hypothetical protein HZS_212 [Henneguya salminicola]